MKIQLEWVLYDSELAHVSTFFEVNRIKRPVVRCPECNKKVVMKLGTKRRHHAAHYPADVCIVNHPETALHLNTKLFIAEQLRKSDKVLTTEYCNNHPKVNECNKKKNIVLFKEWDQVEVEWEEGGYVLDIALLKMGKVVGCIEIFVTHLMETNKIKYLQGKHIPTIEIQVSKDNYQEYWNWSSSVPLEPFTLISNKEPWICDDSKGKFGETRFFRIADYYYPKGLKYREIFTINGFGDELFLFSEIKKINRKLKTSVNEKSIMNQANIILREYSEIEKESNPGVVIDSSMDWKPVNLLPGDSQSLGFEVVSRRSLKFPKIKRYQFDNVLPFRYRYDFSGNPRWTIPDEIKEFKWEHFWENQSEYKQQVNKNKNIFWQTIKRGKHQSRNSPIVRILRSGNTLVVPPCSVCNSRRINISPDGGLTWCMDCEDERENGK